MKTVDQLIDEITINPANLEHIAKTGKINGTLREEIRHAISIFAMQEAGEALKLFGIVDPSTQKNEFAIPDVSVNEVVVCDHSGVNVMPRTKWEQTKR